MNLDIEKLEGLARAATPGPWISENDSLYFNDDGYTRHLLDADAGHDVEEPSYYAALAFIATANPAAVLELIAEITRLKAENEAQRLPSSGYAGAFYEVCKIVGVVGARAASPMSIFRDEVVPEFEALRKDAERYRWLRDERTRPGCLSSDPDKARWLDEYLICGDKLDSTIDAAMAQERKP